MISKSDLIRLIETIQEKTGKTQSAVAEGAGYKPKTLTQIISSGARPEQAYKRLKMAYSEVLKDSTHKDEQPPAEVAKDGKSKKQLSQEGLDLTVDDYIFQIKKHNDFLERLVETNLGKMTSLLQTIMLSQTAHDDVILNSLDRIEGNPEGTLSGAAGKIEKGLKDRLGVLSDMSKSVDHSK